MRECAISMCVAVLFIELLVTGCARKPNTAEMLRLAVRGSNEEAARRFHVEPFGPGDGQMRSMGDVFVWEGLTSSGGRDMIAKVTINQEGAVTDVDVQMLVHPGVDSPTNVPPFGTPQGDPPKSPIPEVLPK